MNSTWRTILGCGLSCMLAVAIPASAESDASSIGTSATQLEPIVAPFSAVLDETALASQRGGQQDAFFNDMRSRAAISQTSTSNVATGTNSISDGAFTNSNGLPMVIQNTGNNVIIQNSTILNVPVR